MLSITEIEQINQKLNPELALSLSLDNATRMESSLLRSGFSLSTDTWKLILFYNGSLEEIKDVISFTFIPLLGNFAILFIKEKDIPSFLAFPQILYVELSRPIYENALTGIDASCFPDYNIITGRNVNETTLTGKGTAIAVLDSGVDYRHPDFRNADGSTRILAYWDQSLPFSDSDATDINSIKNPYQLGIIFSQSDLNRLLKSDSSTNSSSASNSDSFSISSPPSINPANSASDTPQLLDSSLVSSRADHIISPSSDISGHGTHIAGICAGNGRASNGRNQGAAPESSLIVVKLKNETASIYSDYANLMMAVDFAVRFAISRSLPLSINISYGSNDGSHTGTSLLELFLNEVSFYGKNVISVATGNEGLTRRHTFVDFHSSQANFSDTPQNRAPYQSQTFSQIYTPDSTLNSSLNSLPASNAYSKSVSFTIAPDERNLYLEIWQSFADAFSYELFSPDGSQSFSFPAIPGIYTHRIAGTTIYLTINNPTPYQTFQQYFLAFTATLDSIISTRSDSSLNSGSLINEDTVSDMRYITSGIWTLRIRPAQAGKITDGRLQFWLPSKEATNSATGFLSPSSDMTFTIPSTASNVISVSGYDSSLDTFASFSGQGFSNNMHTKPDLCAPAVNILSTAPGGGYNLRTGTSMAAPFVTGAAALLMQYGIVNGNDPFLYGQKVKAYLWKNSRPLPAFSQYPNKSIGWGALCL